MNLVHGSLQNPQQRLIFIKWLFWWRLVSHQFGHDPKEHYFPLEPGLTQNTGKFYHFLKKFLPQTSVIFNLILQS